jgi:hypothetical protein
LQQSKADTILGFIELLNNKPLGDIINFNAESTKNDLLPAARYFQRNGVETFDDVYQWLGPEYNRDNLLTENSGLECKSSDFRVADKTADYIRELVGHWDAVAVDRGINGILAETIGLPRSRKSSWLLLIWAVHREIWIAASIAGILRTSAQVNAPLSGQAKLGDQKSQCPRRYET